MSTKENSPKRYKYGVPVPSRQQFMTELTRLRLEKIGALYNAKAEEVALGGAGTQDNMGDWHDNFAFDQLQIDRHVLATIADRAGFYLRDAVVINPRRETQEVGIGNTVVVQFDGGSLPESFTVLGAADAATKDNEHQGWISHESNFGKALLGRQVHDKIIIPKVDHPEAKDLSVTILEILAGDFETIEELHTKMKAAQLAKMLLHDPDQDVIK